MSNYILEAKNLHKSFPSPSGAIKVLQGIDIKLLHGESLSIRGESGAGKTTLLNLLTLLERPEQGQLFWQDQEVQARRSSFLAQKRGLFMGLVFQRFYLIPELNAIENVIMARRLIGPVRAEDKLRAESLLHSVGLKDRINHLSTDLSGGEMQRVALARAIMNKPPLIIADEPTGNLDERTAGGVMDLLLELSSDQNTSLILVTHNPDYANLTQRQVVLHDGHISS